MKTLDLRPHEETVPDDLQRLVEALKANPVLRHPIIADRKTGIVLDGTHRLAAVKELKCDFIPSALVDYHDQRIMVERWFRVLTGDSVKDFEKGLDRLRPKALSHKECEDGLAERRWFATIEKNTQCLAFPSKTTNVYQMVQASYKIELEARKQKLKITYQDNASAEGNTSESLLLSMIKIEKAEVVATAKRGKLFPPKSTRHLVPSRPLGGGVPLDWLQGTDFSEAQSRYLKFLQSRKVKQLPEGSRVGSRRYLEEVFLFE